MHGKHLFEYAVIRIVPRVEREEFLNAGVILYCAEQRFLQALFEINEPRLSAFSPLLNIADVQASLQAIVRICAGGKDAGPIGFYSAAERFRWLTATRSTIIQTSCVHPGLCTDAPQALQRLYRQLVLS
jgi:hypothetical protein